MEQQSQSGVKKSILIHSDQDEYFAENPHLNLSGTVRKLLDENGYTTADDD